MKTHPDAIENRASWLSEACIRVMRLPKELPPGPGVERLALTLLRSVEAECIPVPGVCVTNRGSIRMSFETSTRQLVIFVTGPNSFTAVRSITGNNKPRVDVTRDWVQEMRMLIAWLCPAANQSPVQMVAGWRDGK